MLQAAFLLAAILTIALIPVVKSNGKLIANYITIGIILLTSLQLFDKKLNPRREDLASYVGIIVGKYIADAWPYGSLVTLSTAGSTPYYAGQNRYIDMLGLNDPVIGKRTISKLEKNWQLVPGLCKGDGAYVLSRCPDFIIVGPASGTLATRTWFLSDLEMSRDPLFYRVIILHLKFT